VADKPFCFFCTCTAPKGGGSGASAGHELDALLRTMLGNSGEVGREITGKVGEDPSAAAMRLSKVLVL